MITPNSVHVKAEEAGFALRSVPCCKIAHPLYICPSVKAGEFGDMYTHVEPSSQPDRQTFCLWKVIHTLGHPSCLLSPCPQALVCTF